MLKAIQITFVQTQVTFKEASFIYALTKWGSAPAGRMLPFVARLTPYFHPPAATMYLHPPNKLVADVAFILLNNTDAPFQISMQKKKILGYF